MSQTSLQQIYNAVEEICLNTLAERVNKFIASLAKREKMCLDVSGVQLSKRITVYQKDLKILTYSGVELCA